MTAAITNLKSSNLNRSLGDFKNKLNSLSAVQCQNLLTSSAEIILNKNSIVNTDLTSIKFSSLSRTTVLISSSNCFNLESQETFSPINRGG